MRNKIISYFLLILQVKSYCQTNVDTIIEHKHLYETAYIEINRMLEGKEPISFKRAVFLMENAYLYKKFDYNILNDKISNISKKLKALVHQHHLEKFKTSGNWAAFTFMTDSIAENNFKPFKYDFDNFLPDKDPKVGFVSKLLLTNKGNCASLPFLYKILVEEIGSTAYLAIAPIHCYIKHKDENGKWVNLELTSGSFARDEWIMQESGITIDQIKSGLYMSPLSQKESLALILKELAANYQFQFGISDLELRIVDTGLKYYPTNDGLYMVKFDHYKEILYWAKKRDNKVIEKHCNLILESIEKKLNDLAYKEPSKEDYEEWIKENKEGKEGITSPKNKTN